MNLFEVYRLWDIEPVRGLGTTLWTADDTEYTDLYGGHAVISIGHCHPHYVEAVGRQLATLGFYSNAVKNGLQTELASRLGRISGYDDYSLFLCNSGAEANENAMKLASFATGRAKILAFGRAFHGRTSGAVSVTDNPKIRAPFNANGNVCFVDLGDSGAVERELAGKEYAAVIIEIIIFAADVFDADYGQPLSDTYVHAPVRGLVTLRGLHKRAVFQLVLYVARIYVGHAFLERVQPVALKYALYLFRTEKSVGAFVLNVNRHLATHGVGLFRVVKRGHGENHIDCENNAKDYTERIFQLLLHLPVLA